MPEYHANSLYLVNFNLLWHPRILQRQIMWNQAINFVTETPHQKLTLKVQITVKSAVNCGNFTLRLISRFLLNSCLDTAFTCFSFKGNMTSNEAAFTEGAKFLVFSYLVSLISKISRVSATHTKNININRI